MPIEIRELHIRVAVNTPPTGAPPASQTTAAGAGTPSGEEAKDALVAECVEQILHILHNKTER